MSLSREAAKEICGYIKEHCATLFGQKFFECRLVKAVQVQSGSKADKFESKFFALAKFRVFLLHGKHTGSLKVEKCFNLLALRQIQVVKESETGLTIGWEVDKSGRTASVFIRLADEKEATDLACELLAALKHYFPDIRDSLTHLITQLSPPTLMSLFAFLPTSTPDLPCHNFRRSYVAYCDFHDQPFKDEVVWDVERIYFVHNIREIRLDDFSHLSVKDQVAILGCIQFSSYFTGIYVDGFRLSPEHLEVVLNVCRRSHALKSLKLVSCGLPKEYAGQLAAAFQANYERLPLECLDLSGNNLDDKKGIAQLASALARIHTLKSIILMDCSLSEKSVHQLSFGLYTGLGMDSSIGKKFELQTLVLARNSLKDDANELVNFVSLCNSLRTLDLSHTGFHVDRLWSALKLGGLLLERLKLGGCQTHVGKKSSSRDSHHQQPVATVVKELFTSMVNLKIEDVQIEQKVQGNKIAKLERNVDQLEYENRKLMFRVEGIPNECTDIEACLLEIMTKGVQLPDFKIEELQQYKFLPNRSKAGKKTATVHFKKEEERKLVLENCKNLKDYRFMKNKVMITPFYTNRQQAIRNVQMATKKAAEIALEKFPQLFNGGAYLRPIGYDKLALPNEKPKDAKSYTYWKNKLIDLGKEASSKPYASSSQEYHHAFNQIIAAEKLI